MENKSRKTILYIVLLIVILGGGFFLYQSYYSDSTKDSLRDIPGLGDTTTGVTTPDITEKISSPNLNTDLLTDPRFSDLIIYGDLPVEVEALGRDNPFLPFPSETKSPEVDSDEEEEEEEETTDESEETDES